jgi:hypothetical protein
MPCQTCGKGYAEGVRTDTYHSASGVLRLCDPCLFADMPRQPQGRLPEISEELDEDLRLHGLAALQ